MAWEKVWLGTVDTDFANPANWQPISLRHAGYVWTQIGATDEYYVRAAGPVDPAFGGKPGLVYLNGALAVEGEFGALAVGEWCYDDPDTLGYDTIVVRVAGDVDPGTLSRDYIQFRAVPNGSDDVTISGLAVRGIESNLDQSGLSSSDWRIEPGFRDKPIGSAGQPLRITPSSLVIDGGGQTPWYLNIGSAAISVDVRNTPLGVNGRQGLYLIGSAIVTLRVSGGVVGVGLLPGDSATVGTVLTLTGQARVTLGEGVTLTTARSVEGTLVLQCGAVTMDCQGGTFETQLAAVASGNVYVRGGTFLDKSAGTHAAVTQEGGTLDTTQLSGAKTYTTYKLNAGTLRENKDLLGITTRAAPDFAGTLTRSRAGS